MFGMFKKEKPPQYLLDMVQERETNFAKMEKLDYEIKTLRDRRDCLQRRNFDIEYFVSQHPRNF